MFISDIKNPPKPTAPYRNFIYRIHCRVAQFFPHRLEDFCIQKKSKQAPVRTICSVTGREKHQYPDGRVVFDEEENGRDNDEEDPTSQDTKEQWEWRFALLVQGEDGARMKLLVDNHSAEYLLRLDAVKYVCLLRGSG